MTQKEIEFLNTIESHKGIIFRVSRMYFDHPEDQEDLRQEIIFQLWISYSSFRNESKFSTWMYRIALNTAIVFFKREKKEKIKIEGYNMFELKLDESMDETETKINALYGSFHHLDKVEKAIIYMYLEDMSHKEIATNLGISEANTRVKFYRIKEKIKSIILKNSKYEF